MRRLIVMAATLAALSAALVVGPMGSSAAAPFVYGCTPVADFVGGPTVSKVILYNGSGAAANITMKLLAFDGTNLSGLMTPPGSVFVVNPTQTKWIQWTNPSGLDPAVSNAIPSTARVVSDQSIAVGLQSQTGNSQGVTECAYLHP